MPHKFIVPIALITALFLTACGAVTIAGGPQISIEDAWARPVPVAGGNGALFFRLVNAGSEADQLLGGRSPLVGTVEVHKTTMEQGVMKMEHIPGLEVPARSEVLLKPGDYHVMLIDVTTTLASGDTLPITLIFEKTGEMTLDVEVRDFSTGPLLDANR